MKKTKPSGIGEVAEKLMEKAGEKAEALKESIIAGKDKVVAIVEEKIESAKKVIHDHTAPKGRAKKKQVVAVKKAPARAAKKQVKKTIKKVAKKVIKKAPA